MNDEVICAMRQVLLFIPNTAERIQQQSDEIHHCG